MCKSTAVSCNGSWKTGLCSGGSKVKCCVPTGNDSSVVTNDDSGCTNIGGICTTGTCSGGTFQAGLCTSSKDRKCCVKNTTSAKICSSDKDCSSTQYCNRVGGTYKCKNKVSEHFKCGEDRDCLTGKCAKTQDAGDYVCVKSSGTSYICAHYGSDAYSEKWVNGHKSSSESCGINGCNSSTGKCGF